MTTTKILWSEDGRLACEEHAPYRGSDTWRSGRWRPLTLDEFDEFQRELGHAPQCEACAADARRPS